MKQGIFILVAHKTSVFVSILHKKLILYILVQQYAIKCATCCKDGGDLSLQQGCTNLINMLLE